MLISKVLDVSLTRSCNFNCSWCNQRYDLTKPMHDMKDASRRIVKNNLRTGAEWIDGLNANPYKQEYHKIIFSGGEPSLHPDFFEIASKVAGYKSKIIVTNLSFDVHRLIDACKTANSRIIVQPSFHFEFTLFESFIDKMRILAKHRMLSNFIPVSIVDLPDSAKSKEFKKKFKRAGFDASVYKFEGYYKGKFVYADVKGFGSLGGTLTVNCSSSCNYVCPNGDVVYCASDTYNDIAKTYGNICDKIYKKIPFSKTCERYGACHISSASWIRTKLPGSKKVIWKGKNFLANSPLNLFRIYCEQKNYSWLSKIKMVRNKYSQIKGKIIK